MIVVTAMTNQVEQQPIISPHVLIELAKICQYVVAGKPATSENGNVVVVCQCTRCRFQRVDLLRKPVRVALFAAQTFDNDHPEIGMGQCREQQESQKQAMHQIVLHRRRSSHSPDFSSSSKRKIAGASHTERYSVSVMPALE